MKASTISMSAAVLIVAAGVVAGLPLLVSSPASAAAVVDGMGQLTLTTDRQAPSGGFTKTDNKLNLRVDNTKANTSSGVTYQTEGLKASLPASRSITVNLFVDPAWAGKSVRATLSGEVSSPSTSTKMYPGIAYVSNDPATGYTGWHVYDVTRYTWVSLPGVDASADRVHKLKISYDAGTTSFNYYVDGALVYTTSAFDPEEYTTFDTFSGVAFNSYNFATGNHADDYTTSWRNFEAR